MTCPKDPGATHWNGCDCVMERMKKMEKALQDIIMHMEIVTNKPMLSTVWNIAYAALEGRKP